ncbi:restriction endonuclease [Amycolatopsis sp. MtRt-6]|uniref:restriction endonuclease n=1 Tax=Amycolatopsis sp. MtRt-6 TaxID=2792782 RepID=UPI001A8DD4F6|nr:restriction endonuclease [Amycolatopsis sp. MtRt-6]
MNAVWRLFDAPIYRDWLFWFTVAWAAFSFVAIFTAGKSSGIPVWLNALLASTFFALVCGIFPAWIRLFIRRWAYKRRLQVKTKNFENMSNSQVADVTLADRAVVGETAPSTSVKGLGVTAADPALVDRLRPGAALSSTTLHVSSYAPLDWSRIDADGFERLLVRLLEQSGSYVRIKRLINVNAADSGCDIEAYRRVDDELARFDKQDERTMVQAKHWPRRGVSASEIADLVHAKLPLWGDGEPVRVLIVATTGTFTQDALRWVNNHNRAAKRPDVVLWSNNELEMLLRKWPTAAAGLGLTP